MILIKYWQIKYRAIAIRTYCHAYMLYMNVRTVRTFKQNQKVGTAHGDDYLRVRESNPGLPRDRRVYYLVSATTNDRYTNADRHKESL